MLALFQSQNARVGTCAQGSGQQDKARSISELHAGSDSTLLPGFPFPVRPGVPAGRLEGLEGLGTDSNMRGFMSQTLAYLCEEPQSV